MAREAVGGETLTKENSNGAHGWRKAVKKGSTGTRTPVVLQVPPSSSIFAVPFI